MMGARQWAGQADVHVVLTPKSEYTETPRDEGGWATQKELELSVKKGRDGVSARPELFTVQGVNEARARAGETPVYVLTDMSVEWGGRIEADTVEGDMCDRILRHLNADPDARHLRKEVAAAIGERDPASPSGTFKRGWRALNEKNWTEKDGQGVRLIDDGRAKVAALGLDC